MAAHDAAPDDVRALDFQADQDSDGRPIRPVHSSASSHARVRRLAIPPSPERILAGQSRA
jgi:hypothetical protein